MEKTSQASGGITIPEVLKCMAVVLEDVVSGVYGGGFGVMVVLNVLKVLF